MVHAFSALNVIYSLPSGEDQKKMLRETASDIVFREPCPMTVPGSSRIVVSGSGGFSLKL